MVGLVLGIILWLVLAYLETSPIAQAAAARIRGPRQGEVDSLRAEVDSLTRKNRDLEWRWQCDEPPPEVEALAEIDRREAQTELSRYGDQLADISRTMGAVLDDFTLALRYDQGDPSCDLFWRYKKTPMMWLLGLAMEPKTEDRRVVFRAFLKQYKDFKKVLRTMAVFQGRDLAAFVGYSAWHTADAAFSKALGTLADIEGTKGTRKFIRDIDACILMPPAATSWEGSGVEHIPLLNAWSPKVHPAPGPFPERSAR